MLGRHPAKLSPTDLIKAMPPAQARWWGVGEKAAVLLAVRSGVVSAAVACAYYGLAEDQLSAWEHVLEQEGLVGLQVQRLFDRQYA